MRKDIENSQKKEQKGGICEQDVTSQMGKCIKTYKYYAHVAKIMAKKEMHKR